MKFEPQCSCDGGPNREHHDWCETRHPDHRCYREVCSLAETVGGPMSATATDIVTRLQSILTNVTDEHDSEVKFAYELASKLDELTLSLGDQRLRILSGSQGRIQALKFAIELISRHLDEVTHGTTQREAAANYRREHVTPIYDRTASTGEPTSRVHELKCWPPFWEAVSTGEKTVELRKNDRDYQVGDALILREWDPIVISDGPCGYTGRVCERLVTHIVRGGSFGLAEGYVALSLEAMTR